MRFDGMHLTLCRFVCCCDCTPTQRICVLHTQRTLTHNVRMSAHPHIYKLTQTQMQVKDVHATTYTHLVYTIHWHAYKRIHQLILYHICMLCSLPYEFRLTSILIGWLKAAAMYSEGKSILTHTHTHAHYAAAAAVAMFNSCQMPHRYIDT